jgi:hypothetical protein
VRYLRHRSSRIEAIEACPTVVRSLSLFSLGFIGIPFVLGIPLLGLSLYKWVLETLVGASGFEPEASCAQGRRATRLRYAPT